MGTAVMIIGIVLMIVIHEGAHFVAAKAFGMKATEAFFGFGPRIWSMTRGETEYGVKAIPLGGYVRIIGMNPLEEIDPDEEARTYRTAVFWKKSIVVLAGIFSHFVVAAILLTVVFVTWGAVATDDAGQPIPTLTLSVVAATTPDGDAVSPASTAGFMAGDHLETYDGMPIATWDEFVDLVRADGGQTAVIGFERDGEQIQAATHLAYTEVPVVVGDEIVRDQDGNIVYEKAGYFGAAPEVAREKIGPTGVVTHVFSGIGTAVGQSVQGLWQMIVGFPKLIASVFGGNQDVLDEVRPISPIGLVRLAGPLESTLMMLALVNVFVGVLNFIPLYPLDGGHFAVALYEKIRGRAPDVTKLMPVAAAVIIFLVAVGLMGVYLDIFKPIQL